MKKHIHLHLCTMLLATAWLFGQSNSAFAVSTSHNVNLKSIQLNGAEIPGFIPGQKDYQLVLQDTVTVYPSLNVEFFSASSTLSDIDYVPEHFDPDTVNTIRFTAFFDTIHTDYSIRLKIDRMPSLSDLILNRIKMDKLSRVMGTLEQDVDGYLLLMQPDGSFSDCHYVSEFRDDGAVLNHLVRLREMGIAYTQTGNKYYESEDIYAKIVKGLEFWYAKHWIDSNWWQNRIGHPQRLGEAFIAMYGGKRDIRNEAIFASLVQRWRSEMGDPDYPADATTAGANKCDIAMHWIYRACLTLHEADLAKAADRSFLIVQKTTGEGVQYDWSYRQHGSQLYIGGYGYVFIQLVTRQASYLAGTKYALSGEKLNILSQFVRNAYLPVIRGQRMSFSTLGRGVTRTENTKQINMLKILEMLKEVDSENSNEYTAAIARIGKESAPSTGLKPFQTHFNRGEYTIQQRPEYSFDIRMASNRMMRSEYDIKENRQGFFMSDGATGIYVDGEEYGSILPFWNWKKIPGTTVPDLTIMPRADNYLFSGRSAFAGGVTDGKNGVTAFDMVNDQALYAYNDDNGFNGVPSATGSRLPALNFGAKKSWFIFDKEIVCLGSGIYSGHDESVFTTVNQCRQSGEALVYTGNNSQTIGKGDFSYDQVDWVLNDKVAYFFPNKPALHVSNLTKTASWNDINSNGSTDQISGDLFTVWFDHGVRPTNESYAYIIVPNIQNKAEASAYQTSNIEILANTDSVQVVYHKELKQYGLAFFRACRFVGDQLAVEANTGCVLLIKNADQPEMNVFVSDPKKQSTPIKIGIASSQLKEAKAVTYLSPASPYEGETKQYLVNSQTQAYEGRNVLLDRSEWSITASSQGPVDATVAVDGDQPGYMIDGDTKSSFLFVKPGKTYGGITVPAGVKPWFAIDMKESQDMTYVIYRHRDYNNASSYLRASKGSFYGKNNETDEYQPIIENFEIANNATEVQIDLPERYSFRYVKFVLEEWNTTTGSTIQVSEFKLGKTAVSKDFVTNLQTPVFQKKELSFTICPNPVRKGESFRIQLNDFKDASLTVYAISGMKISKLNPQSEFTDLNMKQSGVYILEAQKDDQISLEKFVVY